MLTLIFIFLLATVYRFYYISIVLPVRHEQRLTGNLSISQVHHQLNNFQHKSPSINSRTKSLFQYEIVKAGRYTVIKITDIGKYHKTVTNDIENVVEHIAFTEQLQPGSCLIIYCDSTGLWDGWEYKRKAFISLCKNTFDDALKKYLAMQAG